MNKYAIRTSSCTGKIIYSAAKTLQELENEVNERCISSTIKLMPACSDDKNIIKDNYLLKEHDIEYYIY